jgi:UDP-glucose 4-epimerase
MTGTLIQFKYVDFRLLFVVLMGAVYGMRFGLYAAILASLSILYTWIRLSFDWALLTHNVGNWFPFVVYFTAGLLIGYRRDRNEVELEYEKKQTNLIYDKYSFLYGVFNDIRELKDEFRKQLVGYRHSFGKIYSITRELDTFEEDKVFINALRILQEIMENESIAIYTIGSNQNFARLEVNAQILTDKLSKSLNLAEFPLFFESIKQGKVFQNTELLENYPAYISPIMNGETPVALVAIWHATYDQFSLDYLNLFEVICGLIQASLVRASLFLNANLDKMYLPSTRVLKPEAFLEAVRIKIEMRRNKIADFQLLRIHTNGLGYQDIYTQISNKIRVTDIIGAHVDGNCYILLSQAEKRSVSEIIKRIGILEVEMDLIDTNELEMSA